MMAQPAIQLHFDINGTMILQDKSIRKNDVFKILKEEFAKRVVGREVDGKFVWDGNDKWETWEEKYDPENGDMTYAEYVKKHFPANEKQKQYEKLIDSPEMLPFRPVLDRLHQQSMVHDADESHYYILPSFFQLLNYLIDHDRKFNIILRSYGSEVRLEKLRNELNSFFKGVHPRFKVAIRTDSEEALDVIPSSTEPDDSSDGKKRSSTRSKKSSYAPSDRKKSSVLFRRLSSQRRLSNIMEANRLHEIETAQKHRTLASNKHIGILYRDKDGALLTIGTAERPPTATEWCDTHTFDIKPGEYEDTRKGREFYSDAMKRTPEQISLFDGYSAIYERFHAATLDGETIAIRDDYTWWKTNHFASTAGKPHLIDRADEDLHPIFFDDNIKATHGQPHIIDVIDIHNGENLSFAEANDLYVVAAHPLRALADIDYYVNALIKCEEKRNATMV